MKLELIKGIGTETEKKLNKLNIFSALDLLMTVPKNYLDMTIVGNINDYVIGDYCLIEIFDIKKESFNPKKGKTYFKIIAKSGNNKINIIWFNLSYLYNFLEPEKKYYIWGKLEKDFSFINPKIEETINVKQLNAINPVYPLKGLISHSTFKKFAIDALNKFCFEDFLTARNLEMFELESIKTLFEKVHNPKSVEEGIDAQSKLAKMELICKLLNSRNKIKRDFDYRSVDFTQILNKLPYKLTKSQELGIEKFVKLFYSQFYNQSLIVGDVGSGKTIIAILATYYTIKNAGQVMFLAPTLILSAQHYENIKEIFSNENIRIELLNSSISKKDKDKIINDFNSGMIDLLIGTHSLLSDSIVGINIKLIILDELHKFGVKQKHQLLAEKKADIITLTATPLPRTLALLMYGENNLIELENIRKDKVIKTYVIDDDKIDRFWKYLENRALNGTQSYVVCPRIYDNDGLDIYSAKKLFNELKLKLNNISISLLTGLSKEKEQIMQDFKTNKTQILIATSVIEVGIDIPNSNIICVLNADRFGLSQLHQLRGRVGRGYENGECFLHTSTKKQDTIENLKKLIKLTDGYEISLYDSENRGLGDIVGFNQSGDSGESKYLAKINKQFYIDAINCANLVDSGIENLIYRYFNEGKEQTILL